MIPQFPEDFFHLKRGDNGLDEHRCADRTVRYAELVLRRREYVVPQARLEVRLQLRQVVVGSGPALDQLSRIVEKEQCEIEYAAGHGIAINRDVLFVEMPATRPRHQDR